MCVKGITFPAVMAELADAPDLSPGSVRSAGSIPADRTILQRLIVGQKFVLWIDDEPIRSHMLGDEITNAVIIFAHGFDQISYYLDRSRSRIEFSLIILDHDMPLMDGMSVCQTFLLDRGTPVLLCSNNSSGRRKQLDWLRQYDDETWKYPVTEHDITWPNFRQVVQSLLE